MLLEINVDRERLEAVVELLPAMKAPTVQPLSNENSYAVKAAVPVQDVPGLILLLKRAGATDILETPLRRVTP